jgi:hypothetical protein
MSHFTAGERLAGFALGPSIIAGQRAVAALAIRIEIAPAGPAIAETVVIAAERTPAFLVAAAAREGAALALAIPVAARAALAAAAFALLPHLVFAAAPVRLVVAEPRSDLVAGALEEAAVIAAAAIAARGSLGLPARTFIARSVALLVTVICHIVLHKGSIGTGGNADRDLREKTNGRTRLFRRGRLLER